MPQAGPEWTVMRRAGEAWWCQMTGRKPEWPGGGATEGAGGRKCTVLGQESPFAQMSGGGFGEGCGDG
jgi:hypothetical protein